MELLDRYLQAVKFWLPKEQKQDIIAELSEDLHSQIEDRETELGRKLNEAEVAAILKERGRPVLVANRFLPQQYLIGPVLFPVYSFVLKIVALCYLVPWALVWIGIMSSSPAYRMNHGGWARAALSAWGSLWGIAFAAIATTTLVFAVLERVQAKSRFLENWDPRKLPAVRDPNRIPLANSAAEVVANLVFCIWWVGWMWYRTFIHFGVVSITLAPVWRYFFWGFLVLALVNITASGANLFRPYWTWSRASVRLATDCMGSALVCWLTKANLVQVLSVINAPAEKTAHVAHAINGWAARMFPWAVAVGLIIALVDVYRIIRVRSKKHQVIQSQAAVVVP
ncbi:MAG: hypothetical protein WB421_01740 [Terriglobales bacterium]